MTYSEIVKQKTKRDIEELKQILEKGDITYKEYENELSKLKKYLK